MRNANIFDVFNNVDSGLPKPTPENLKKIISYISFSANAKDFEDPTKYGAATISAGGELERKLGFHPLNATKGKRKIKLQKPGVDGPSIYDLVGQKIDVP